MPMTRQERKAGLGYGGMAYIARECGFSKAWVTAVVNCEETGKRSSILEAAVVEVINFHRRRAKLAPVRHEDVFPPIPPTAAMLADEALHRTLHRRAS